jgi:hypothetical protein
MPARCPQHARSGHRQEHFTKHHAFRCAQRSGRIQKAWIDLLKCAQRSPVRQWKRHHCCGYHRRRPRKDDCDADPLQHLTDQAATAANKTANTIRAILQQRTKRLFPTTVSDLMFLPVRSLILRRPAPRAMCRAYHKVSYALCGPDSHPAHTAFSTD